MGWGTFWEKGSFLTQPSENFTIPKLSISHLIEKRKIWFATPTCVPNPPTHLPASLHINFFNSTLIPVLPYENFQVLVSLCKQKLFKVLFLQIILLSKTKRPIATLYKCCVFDVFFCLNFLRLMSK